MATKRDRSSRFRVGAGIVVRDSNNETDFSVAASSGSKKATRTNSTSTAP